MLVALLFAPAACVGDDPAAPNGKPPPDPKRAFESNDEVKRACGLEKRELVRIWRGYRLGRSEEIVTVPLQPNYIGSFEVPSHSGPWDYLQRVPLVLYGPGRIAAAGPLDTPAGLVDVFTTVGAITGEPLPARSGRVLEEALPNEVSGGPRLVMVVVWDGVGHNVLERWPDAWPNLARLEREGTSYRNATVGSSPSVTPATHSTLGTGLFPRDHGATSINYRAGDGSLRQSFDRLDPAALDETTFADDLDRAVGNRARVGLLGHQVWHVGMMGHGAAHEGGDRDEVALIRVNRIPQDTGPYFAPAPYLADDTHLLTQHGEQVDASDGKVDGKWLDHELFGDRQNPAWVAYERDLVLEMLEDGYGADSVTDYLFVNFKITDLVGHAYTMDSPEMEAVLEAQDDALGEIVAALDERVGDYALVLTADHGHTPSPERSGAWAIDGDEVERDVNAEFGATSDRPLAVRLTSAGLFIDPQVAEERGVETHEIARFLNGYTIGDNASPPPPGFEARAGEAVFEAAFSGEALPAVMRCALGRSTPPRDFDA